MPCGDNIARPPSPPPTFLGLELLLLFVLSGSALLGGPTCHLGSPTVRSQLRCFLVSRPAKDGALKLTLGIRLPTVESFRAVRPLKPRLFGDILGGLVSHAQTAEHAESVKDAVAKKRHSRIEGLVPRLHKFIERSFDLQLDQDGARGESAKASQLLHHLGDVTALARVPDPLHFHVMRPGKDEQELA